MERKMNFLVAVAICLLWSFTAAQQPPSCLCFDEVTGARNYRNPLILQSARDGTRRRFIGEQVGIVYVFMPGSNDPLPTPFMDLSSIVLTSSRSGDERGLLQILFHPNHRTNRKLYVWFSRRVSGNEHTTLLEIEAMASDRNRTDPDTARVILDLEQPYSNHNGMVFGDDGYLYLGIGDGGAGGDPDDVALDLGSLLGKMIRIDVNRQEGGRQYAIPSDNPFVGRAGARGEIWSIGLRNPWRIDFDEGDPNNMAATRGRIFIADVGQNAIEEVSLLPPRTGGLNFGWSAFEGTECYKILECVGIGDQVTDPILEYNHGVGQSITGGHVYRGCSNPNLQGLYLYDDYVSGRMWYGRQSGNSWTATQISGCTNAQCQAVDRNLIGQLGSYDRFLSWGEDEDGEIYTLSTNNPSPTHRGGRVYRVVDISNRRPVCPGGPSRPAK